MRPARLPPKANRAGSWSSPMGAGAAGTAHAIVRSPPPSTAQSSGPCSSICSPRMKRRSTCARVNIDSTCGCWGIVSSQPSIGSARVDESPIGVFGASTGAAAALIAAAARPREVFAVVSRGGRPDLAGDDLPSVRAPTLLIVGSRDTAVLEMNKSARAQMDAETALEVIPGATHLFEEPGALDEVARLALDWFQRQLPQMRVRSREG